MQKLKCPKCGFEGEPREFKAGAKFHPGCWLYLLGVMPGLVWTIYWVMRKDKSRCPNCRNVF